LPSLTFLRPVIAVRHRDDRLPDATRGVSSDGARFIEHQHAPLSERVVRNRPRWVRVTGIPAGHLSAMTGAASYRKTHAYQPHRFGAYTGFARPVGIVPAHRPAFRAINPDVGHHLQGQAIRLSGSKCL
jgi:hypothetical protein